MLMEKLVEWLAGETEVLGENLPQYRFVHHKPHMLPGREPGPPTTFGRQIVVTCFSIWLTVRPKYMDAKQSLKRNVINVL
jgi:hypothetical protein